MYENINTNMEITEIWKHTNTHVEKYKCEACKRVCKESKYIYIYIYKTIK